MDISKLDESDKYVTVFESDSNGREINIYKLPSVIATGESLLYPNPLFYSNTKNTLYSPIDENIMSLKDVKKKSTFDVVGLKHTVVETNPVFFFVYNTDNYFHFIYDTY